MEENELQRRSGVDPCVTFIDSMVMLIDQHTFLLCSVSFSDERATRTLAKVEW